MVVPGSGGGVGAGRRSLACGSLLGLLDPGAGASAGAGAARPSLRRI